MLITIIRNQPQHNAVTGTLTIHSVFGIEGTFVCHTLENLEHIIPAGTYPVRLTMSAKFGEVLPILDHVIGRTGIRIHPGNTARDSAGCILVGQLADGDSRLLSSRRTFNALRETLLAAYRNHETIFITITDYDPHPLYQFPCPKRERMYNA